VAKRKKGDRAIIASLTEHEVRNLIRREAEILGNLATLVWGAGPKEDLLKSARRLLGLIELLPAKDGG
jgi:hypothetical protein